MTYEWPQPGHSTWYSTTENLDGYPPLTYDLSLPSSMSTFDLSTVRVGRHGGPTDEDEVFRRGLFQLVGAITVAGGHVETAMKRLLLLMTETEGRFSLVDKTWTDLHNALVAQAETGQDDLRTALRDALQWGETNRVKVRRDNAVHAYWWIYEGCGARRSRFYRKTEGKTILAQLTDLDEDADLLFEYARRLDELAGPDWPIAMLPAPAN
jgi:hypothetical protein